MRVALIHDHLTQAGGAERVLESMQALWPDAPTFTLLYDAQKMDSMFGHKDIRTSFLQNIPFAHKKTRWLLPLMPTATERYDLSEFDVIISNSSAFSKGIIPAPHALHISYCHTPTRYLWSDTHSYVQNIKAPKLAKRALPPILSRLRSWDYLAASRVDHFIANSNAIKHRIKRYYNRDATVIYPPVDFAQFRIDDSPKNFFLIGGRLVAYKRYDLVVEAFNKLGLPLKIFGTGPQEKELQAMAASNIEFLGRVSDDVRATLFSQAIAFLHPQEEDFGITPIESMAAGRPVIAYAKGGALETVIDGKTGILFHNQTWEELADTILTFNHHQFDPTAIRAHAKQFTSDIFNKNLQQFVQTQWQHHERHVLGKI